MIIERWGFSPREYDSKCFVIIREDHGPHTSWLGDVWRDQNKEWWILSDYYPVWSVYPRLAIYEMIAQWSSSKRCNYVEFSE